MFFENTIQLPPNINDVDIRESLVVDSRLSIANPIDIIDASSGPELPHVSAITVDELTNANMNLSTFSAITVADESMIGITALVTERNEFVGFKQP